MDKISQNLPALHAITPNTFLMFRTWIQISVTGISHNHILHSVYNKCEESRPLKWLNIHCKICHIKRPA